MKKDAILLTEVNKAISQVRLETWSLYYRLHKVEKEVADAWFSRLD